MTHGVSNDDWMIDQLHTIDDQRQTVVRQIGDVRVTLDMPVDMGAPLIALSLHRHSSTTHDRLSALEAFGMIDEEHLNENDEIYWYRRDEDQISATVFFDLPPKPAA